MDIETRTYLKKMIEDAGHAQLIMSVLQRFANQMSVAEVEALNLATTIFLKEAQDYLGINNEGKLVVTDPEELKKLGLDVPMADESAGAEGEDAELDEPIPTPAPQPATKPGKAKEKKGDYT